MCLSKIQWISLCGSLIFMMIILWHVRQQKLKEAYAILWIAIGLGMNVLSVWTGGLYIISDYIGIVYPPATLFLLLMCGLILILFQYSLLLSRNQERISRLAQEMAVLKNELERLKGKQ